MAFHVQGIVLFVWYLCQIYSLGREEMTYYSLANDFGLKYERFNSDRVSNIFCQSTKQNAM